MTLKTQEFSELLFAGLDADTVLWQTANGETYTVARMRQECEQQTATAEMYITDVLNVSRDLLCRQKKGQGDEIDIPKASEIKRKVAGADGENGVKLTSFLVSEITKAKQFPLYVSMNKLPPGTHPALKEVIDLLRSKGWHILSPSDPKSGMSDYMTIDFK